MTAQVSALKWAPEFARGYVKDLRVRWALEEAELSYEPVLVGEDARAGRAYRAWQPIGQVPAYRDAQVEMFESGAIVLHIASKSEKLSPTDPAGRARVGSWVFAATTSIQPYVDNYAFLRPLLPDDKKDVVDAPLSARLGALEDWIGDGTYLEGRFTAGDLVMTTVIREVDDAVLARFPALLSYLERCQERPAFTRALEAQLADFNDTS